MLSTFTAYANYGTLAHEKEIVWSGDKINDWNTIQDECAFKVPTNSHITDCYLNSRDEVIFVIDNRYNYTIDEIMDNSPAGRPCLKWYDGKSYHTILLEEEK